MLKAASTARSPRSAGTAARAEAIASGKEAEKNLLPMEALSVASLPVGKDWVYEPKWDGFRCLARKHDGVVSLISKSGKPLDRYFPDIVDRLQKLKAAEFLLDGELLIESEGAFSFSALQLRLHPAASRVAKLAMTNPASLVLFDLLRDETGTDLMSQPFAKRRKTLEKFTARFAAKENALTLSPQSGSLDAARQWLHALGGQLDGLVAKNLSDVYAPGERKMQKYKFLRSADCVVGGFRYGANSKEVGSLLLGLYDDTGALNHVGFTSALAASEKKALTKKLEKLAGGEGFTGKAPGGPSRWSTERSAEWTPLKPELVVEVSYDHVSDDRFRHGTKILRWRPDKSPSQCRMEQLHQPKILGI